MQVIERTNLDKLICQVKEKLEELDYSIHTQKDLNTYFNNLRKYAESKGTTEFTEQLGADFLKERYNYPFKPNGRLCTTIQNASRAVGLLTSYQKSGEIGRRKKCKSKRLVKNAAFQNIIDKYADSIKHNYRHLHSVNHHMNTVHDFVDCLSEQNIMDCEDLTANHISGFLQTFIKAARGSRKSKLTHMRVFLRFLYAEKHASINLSLAIPTLRLGRYKYVPEPFTTEETETFLSSIDTTKAHGKGQGIYYTFLHCVKRSPYDELCLAF